MSKWEKECWRFDLALFLVWSLATRIMSEDRVCKQKKHRYMGLECFAWSHMKNADIRERKFSMNKSVSNLCVLSDSWSWCLSSRFHPLFHAPLAENKRTVGKRKYNQAHRGIRICCECYETRTILQFSKSPSARGTNLTTFNARSTTIPATWRHQWMKICLLIDWEWKVSQRKAEKIIHDQLFSLRANTSWSQPRDEMIETSLKGKKSA